MEDALRWRSIQGNGQTHDDGLKDDSIPHQTVAIKRRFVVQ
jgi:hypothetical protein